jgi:hypothetical protein
MAYPNTSYNQINAITRDLIIPKMVDQMWRSNVLFDRLSKKVEMKDGGNNVRQPIAYQAGSYGGWYNGLDTLNVVDTDQFTNLNFDWKQIYEPIVISGRDEAINQGSHAVLQLVANKVRIAQRQIRDTIGTGLYNAGTTTNAIHGARLYCSTSSTYGGISQTSYSWLQAQVDSSTTVLSVAAMQGMFGDCTIDGESPDLVMVTQDNYDRYFLLLQPQQRFQDSKLAEGGFTSLKFNAADVVVDYKVPSNYLFFFNTNYLHLYGMTGNWFRFREFQEPENQDGKVAHIFSYLCHTCSSPRMQGVLSAVTS